MPIDILKPANREIGAWNSLNVFSMLSMADKPVKNPLGTSSTVNFMD